MLRNITGFLLLMIVQVSLAQNISVENFQQHKHYFWQLNSPLPLDKKNAVVMFKTEGKGFGFKNANGHEIEAEEVDEGILVKVPDKTKFIVISHPEFGEFTWRVPLKYLKKHKYYTANLVSTDLTKKFSNPNQWVVFNITPENSILTIDSVMYRVNNGNLSLYLPIGAHSFLVESPFYEAVADSITLTDSLKIEKNIYLQPFYSYLTIKTEDRDTEIYVDEISHGFGSTSLGRIDEGNHRITLIKKTQLVKDTMVFVEKAEKKTILFADNFTGKNIKVISEKFIKNPSPNIYRTQTNIRTNSSKSFNDLIKIPGSVIKAPVHLMAEDSLTKIYVDREFMGLGEWKGTLTQGIHLVTTEKNGTESLSQFIEIADNNPVDLNLIVPESSFGNVNIQSNVSGADIIYKEEKIGTTPCIINNLKANENHTLIIKKEGYHEKSVTVYPKSNDISDVYIDLKKI